MDNKKRTIIQSIAVLIQNANWKGFFTGKIYEGAAKNICVPGLNCYSCPGAVGACPIGALQSTISGYKFKFPYYVLGLLIFFGSILGRMVCGFLCPFGFLQDLLHKIPFPVKLRTFKGDKILRYLKYIILILCVIVLPVFFKFTPVFCKYICPSGTLAGIMLSVSNTELFQVLGKLFSWKLSILIFVLIISVMIYRPFCKYLCPLGAFYAPFNHFALVRMQVDPEQCVHCSKCQQVCDMCVNPSLHPNAAECIRCGKCVELCPRNALQIGIVKRQKE